MTESDSNEYEKIKEWFLKESMKYAFELDDLTYTDFLEQIKEIVVEKLQKINQNS